MHFKSPIMRSHASKASLDFVRYTNAASSPDTIRTKDVARSRRRPRRRRRPGTSTWSPSALIALPVQGGFGAAE